jgi:hypothetical protein
MLIVVLLEDRIEDRRVKDRITPLITTATELRATAEEQAADGRTRQAIATLEESTSHLVKAIRSAGVYIPE